MSRAKGILEAVLIVGLLTAHALVQIHLAWEESDIIDEQGHLAASVGYVRKSLFRIYHVNPPLPRFVQGLCLTGVPLDTSMIVDPERHGERVNGRVGESFYKAHAADYRNLLFRARMGTLAFALLGGLLVWHWANLAFGRPCGLVALFVWCCDPMVLAHGHYVSPDLPAAVLALLAAFTLRGYLLQPGWWRAMLVGLVFGLAQLSKFTFVVLAPVWLLLWATLAPPPLRVRLGQGLLAAVVALFTLNAGYFFQDIGHRLDSFRLHSSKLRTFFPEDIDSIHTEANALQYSWVGSLPLPLPAAYLEGIDLQARDFDFYAVRNAKFYLAGQWAPGGWYHYYLYGLLVKMPLAVFGLLLVAVVGLIRRPASRTDLALLLVPALAILLFVSSQKSMNKHIRYVLPATPFAVVLAGAAGLALRERRVIPTAVTGLLLVWLLAAAWRASRDPLAYFNEAAGGPAGGINHLAGSNIDWGQNLHRLRDWLEAHRDFRPIGIAPYGSGKELLGELWDRLPPLNPPAPVPGRYAVSVRLLIGDGSGLIGPDGEYVALRRDSLAWLRDFEPVATIGDGFWIYDITPEQAERVRQARRLPLPDRP